MIYLIYENSIVQIEYFLMKQAYFLYSLKDKTPQMNTQSVVEKEVHILIVYDDSIYKYLKKKTSMRQRSSLTGLLIFIFFFILSNLFSCVIYAMY